MSLSIVTDATGEPVSVGEVRMHCRINSTAEDILLGNYIKTARLYAENYTKRDFMPKTRKLVLDSFATKISLPRPPLTTSTSTGDVSIEYVNTGGTTTTVGSSVYVLDSDSKPGRIILAYGQEWPNIRNETGAVRITYKSGYPLDASSNVTTPEPVKDWIKMRVCQMYEQREPVMIDKGFRYLRRDFVDGLLDEFRILQVST